MVEFIQWASSQHTAIVSFKEDIDVGDEYTIDLEKEVIRLDHPEGLRSRRNEIDLNEEWSDELREDVKRRETYDNYFIGWDKEGVSGYVKS